MRVLVTGAAGFVGRPLCLRLASEGHDVIAATRSAVALGAGIHNVAVGDLTQMKFWPMLDGCDAVVHLAAHVHRMNVTPADEEKFREVNVDATMRLAHDARTRGVKRFVFLSTVKVHGEASDSPFVETSPIAPADSYSRSKAEAELAVRDAGVPSVIFRPPLVYGPSVGANFLRLVDAIARRRPLPLGKVDNRRSLLYVGNLVDALVSSLNEDRDIRGVYLLRDGEDVSSGELVRRIAAALDMKPRLVSVPLGLLKAGGFVTGRAGAVRRLIGSLEVDDSSIRSDLGWTPPFTLDEGLRETARWYWTEARR